MAYENVLLQRDGAVSTVTVNRPQALNALNPATVDELLRCCDEIQRDRAVRCVIVTGAGEKAFVAGADIAAMAAMSPLQGREFSRHGHRLMSTLEDLAIPVIAAVNGFALGGGLELALACDVIFASQAAKFGQPEINIGVMPGAGGTQRLTRAIGKGRAMEMILTGKMISADEALRHGLVNKVVPVEYYLEEAKALAKEIASKPPIAVHLAKEAILKAFDTTVEVGLEYERRNFYLLFASEDQKEGMKAFVEKRKAEWRGK